VHLLISTVARSKQFRKLMGVPEYLPGSILEKLVTTNLPFKVIAWSKEA
jgi:hypothetical protein